ncbi:MAG: tRNA dihydrouridine(20/20a) synthase DusA [Burkholderiaceae bacterium]
MNQAPKTFSVAPMMDWTDRHCRFFHRALSRRARLFTEMVTTMAILHGDQRRLLGFDRLEHPVALQLGGSTPEDLAECARIAERWGYDEVNLNCGCPSDRVREGSFGACLMAEPALVAACVRAMRDAVSLPVTVKHRIGLGRDESYGMVRDFVGQVAAAGCKTFYVHARNAWLDGLNPKENRTIPPLRYDIVHRLKHDFPDLSIHLNGGLLDHHAIEQATAGLDGVMIGRAAYENPSMLVEVDQRYGDGDRWPERGAGSGTIAPDASGTVELERVIAKMVDYAQREIAREVPLRCITRHMLGLFNGRPGARQWRRTLSDVAHLRANQPDLLWRAYAAMREVASAETDRACQEQSDRDHAH